MARLKCRKVPFRVYVDVEGNSDGRSIYLIGLLIASGTDEKMHSFWADTQKQEAAIFDQLLATVAQYKDFSLFHFGNYELAFFKRMREETDNRTLADRLLDRSCNVLSLIYSNIYFPTYSNSLKDIGNYLGFRCPTRMHPAYRVSSGDNDGNRALTAV